MELLSCKWCKCDHELTEKYWKKRGNHYQCKARTLATHKEWKQRNSERWKELLRDHYQRNRKKVIERNYKYAAKRRLVDPNYNLTIILRQRFNRALKSGYKAGSAVRDLGCSIDEFRTHIESKWQSGMTWRNHGRGNGKWNIDHIIPISRFNLSDSEEVKQACHYTNLQPLWFIDNVRKSDKTESVG